MSSYIMLIVACPIEGQVRKECASHPDCHKTCNTTGSVVCPSVCIVNGCECPDGTVIDEDNNECVAPRECEGMYHNIISHFPLHICTYNLTNS